MKWREELSIKFNDYWIFESDLNGEGNFRIYADGLGLYVKDKHQ